MAATLLQLRDQLILDAGIEGNPKFPTPRLNRLINLAQRYVQTELNGLGMKKWEKKATIGTMTAAAFASASNNVKTASLPTDMLETPSSILFLEITGATSTGLAYEVDKDRFLEQLNNTYLAPTEKQPIFMRLANLMYIAPSTSASGSVHYYKAIPDLSADGDSTEIPVEFEEFIIKKARMEVDLVLGKLQEKEQASAQLSRDLSAAYEKFLGKQVELNRGNTRDNKAKLQ